MSKSNNGASDNLIGRDRAVQEWLERSNALKDTFERLGSLAEDYKKMAVILFLELTLEDDPKKAELLEDCRSEIRRIYHQQKSK